MMEWQQQIVAGIIREVQSQVGVTGRIAFAYEPDEKRIYWTGVDESLRIPYTAASALMQLMCTQLDTTKIRKITLLTTGAGGNDSRIVGMKQFLSIEGAVKTITPATDLKGGPNFNLTQLLADDLTDRGELKQFNHFHASLANATPVVLMPTVIPTNAVSHQNTLHRIYMMVAYALVAKFLGTENAGNSGYNIGAVLVAASGEILAWGVNLVRLNYTYHAEVNTLQSYYAYKREAAPNTARLYTTLKPCNMCAGLLAAVPGLQVYYSQEDYGSHAKNTYLDGSNRLFRLGSGQLKPIRLLEKKPTGTVAFKNVESTPMKTEHGTKTPPSAALDNMGSFLHTIGTYYNYASVVQSLANQDSADAIRFAGADLTRKAQKYATDGSWKNTEVWRAMQYVKQFMQAVGIPNW